MNKVYITNIITNADGTINYSWTEKDVNGSVVSSHDEVNIIVDASKSVNENILARESSGLEVVFEDGSEHVGEADVPLEPEPIAAVQ